MDGPRTVATRWQDAYSAHDEQAIRGVLADDARLVSPDGVFSGAPTIAGYMMAWADAFPDSEYTPQHVRVDDDTVMMESMFTGTHSGTLVDPSGDIPASNRTVAARSAYAIVVDGERVTEIRMYFDVFGFLAQLGVIPAAASTG